MMLEEYTDAEIEDASETAAAIGHGLAEQGRASVLPWATSFLFWAGCVRVLGLPEAERIARAAMVGDSDY